MTSEGSSSKVRPVLWLAVVVFLTATLGASWVLASPPGSSADEDFHIGSIWCFEGVTGNPCQNLGTYAANPVFTAVSINGLDGLIQCYVPDVTASAVCQRAAAETQQAFRVEQEGLYPQDFYSFMHLFVGDDPITSLLTMRFVSFTICAALLGMGLALLGRRERARTLLYWLVASVPLALFLFASINPSGVAIASAATVFTAVVALSRSSAGKRPIVAGILAAVAAWVATGSRSDGLYFCGLALALAVLAGATLRPRPTARQLLALLPLASVLVFRYLTQSVGELEVVSGTSGVGWMQNLVRVPGVYANDGTTVGWLETGMPEAVWVGRTLLLGAVLAIGMAASRWRRATSLAAIVFAMVAVPVLMLAQVNYRYGEWLQARYVLAFVFILVSTMALAFDRDEPVLSLPQALVVSVVISIVHTIALHVTMRRYVTGVDVSGFNLDVSKEWWWQGIPVSPMVVWALGSISFALLAAAVALRASRRPERGRIGSALASERP